MNSYQNLSLKWRPKNFCNFKGHNSIIKIINNILVTKHIHSSYLFYGPRGVGKTTLARLLSKGLNCVKGITNNFCKKCINCINISLGKAVDVIEIDAASSTKVEDIRDIISKIYYLPIVMRFKVYIIDEVHMLSRHSFNALLKTLEEPPTYVKFILATTEFNKIPNTILSRCMSFYLSPLSFWDVLDRLIYILKKEEIFYEIDALNFIVIKSEGSMRDALFLVDQLLLFNSKKKILLKDINYFFNLVEEKFVISFLENLVLNNKKDILKKLSFITFKNIDYLSLVDLLINYVHDMYLLSTYKQISNKYLNISFYVYKKLVNLIEFISHKDIKYIYNILLYCKKNMYLFINNKKMIFEFGIFRIFTKNIN